MDREYFGRDSFTGSYCRRFCARGKCTDLGRFAGHTCGSAWGSRSQAFPCPGRGKCGIRWVSVSSLRRECSGPECRSLPGGDPLLVASPTPLRPPHTPPHMPTLRGRGRQCWNSAEFVHGHEFLHLRPLLDPHPPKQDPEHSSGHTGSFPGPHLSAGAPQGLLVAWGQGMFGIVSAYASAFSYDSWEWPTPARSSFCGLDTRTASAFPRA